MLDKVDIADRAISCSQEPQTLIAINTAGKPVRIKKGRPVAEMFLLKNFKLSDFVETHGTTKVPMLAEVEVIQMIRKLEEIESRVIFPKLEREEIETSGKKFSKVDDCENEYMTEHNQSSHTVTSAHYYIEKMSRSEITQSAELTPCRPDRGGPAENGYAFFAKAKKPTVEEARKVLESIKNYRKERREIFEKKLENEHPDIRQVFNEYYDLFDGDLPEQWNALRVKPIKLPVKDDLPEQIKPTYRPKFDDKQMEVIEEFLVTSLARRIIRKSTSNFMSNILLVKRPEIKPGVPRPMRLTIDYRTVNQKAMASAPHPIPEIGDVTAKLGNKRIFTSVDISNAYWRAPLHEESKKWTGFIVNQGHLAGAYEWNYIPFGLKAAPQLFSGIVQDSFQYMSLYGCSWFLDDIIQASGKAEDTWEEAIQKHSIDLRRMFGRARSRGFRSSIEKCSIGKEYTQYLGHMLG